MDFSTPFPPLPKPQTEAEKRLAILNYQKKMADQIGKQLLEARSELVKKYRQNKAPWPDGIDSKWDRWYVKEHWTDAGEFIGPVNWFDAKHPDAVIQESVTKTPLAGKPAVTKTPEKIIPLQVSVTATGGVPKGGRPKKTDKLSGAEKTRRWRERQSTK